MVYGYARISTKDQKLEFQIDALKNAGCEEIFTDTLSGAKKERLGLTGLLDNLTRGDTLIVWKLDRLGRSLKNLVELMNDILDRGVEFRSLSDAIDTSTSQGRLMFHVFASLAEFERELIQERTQAGLAAARARGRMGGRPKGLSDKAEVKAAAAKTMYLEGILTVDEISEQLEISKTTLYKYLRHKKVIN